MKYAALIFSCLAGSLLFGCGQGTKSESAVPAKSESAVLAEAESAILGKIWRAFTNHPGNVGSGIRSIEVKGNLVEKGSVPPSAMNSSAEGRLPAYLACFDYVMVVPGAGDMKTDLCIYYIENPSRGNHSVMWRGKMYVDQLKSRMDNHGFTRN